MAEQETTSRTEAGAGERYPEDVMRDSLLAFPSETQAARSGTPRPARVRSLSADRELAKAVDYQRGQHQRRRITLKQAFGLAASAALAIAASGGWRATRGESALLIPVHAVPLVNLESAGELAVDRPASAADRKAAAPGPDVLASEGELFVVSDPPGARVIVNGIAWGDTPLTIRYLPLGDKRVLVMRSGYVSQERSVRLAAERGRATIRVTLSPQD